MRLVLPVKDHGLYSQKLLLETFIGSLSGNKKHVNYQIKFTINLP